MKQFVSSLLILVSLLCLIGCDSTNGEKSASFYYVRNSYIYGQEDGVITAEVRRIEEFPSQQDVLLAYLNGPQDLSLASPFPKGMKVYEFLFQEDTLRITLSAHIVTLSKAEQVLACACFARTAMELTGVNEVHFQTDDADFARMDPIVISKDSVLLYDDYNSPTPTDP